MSNEVRRLEDVDTDTGDQPRRLGLSWNNLTIRGVDSNATFNENVLSQFQPFHKGPKNSHLKTIVDDSSGCVKPGEMLLVLGRPGAGCTSLLSVLANNRLGFKEVEGDVRYGNMSAKEAESYRGQIVMNTEEEVFFPTLSVDNTIDFATRMKAPPRVPEGMRTREE